MSNKSKTIRAGSLSVNFLYELISASVRMVTRTAVSSRFILIDWRRVCWFCALENSGKMSWYPNRIISIQNSECLIL